MAPIEKGQKPLCDVLNFIAEAHNHGIYTASHRFQYTTALRQTARTLGPEWEERSVGELVARLKPLRSSLGSIAKNEGSALSYWRRTSKLLSHFYEWEGRDFSEWRAAIAGDGHQGELFTKGEGGQLQPAWRTYPVGRGAELKMPANATARELRAAARQLELIRQMIEAEAEELEKDSV